MYWGSSALSVLVGVGGGVALVCSVLLVRRLEPRRAVGLAGAGLMALGLSLSGIIEVFARALAILSFNPLRWLGLGAAVLGFVLLSWSGLLPGRRRSPKQVTSRRADKAQVEGRKQAEPAIDDDLAEIEEILRRRGIS